jgi:hypothetical protein
MAVTLLLYPWTFLFSLLFLMAILVYDERSVMVSKSGK